MNDDELLELVRTLERKGVTGRRAQAEELGIGLSTLMRRLKRVNATSPRLDHSEWIPWPKISEADYNHNTYRYLTMLSQAAQGVPTEHAHLRASAVHWAEGLLDRGMDVTYRQKWRVVPADPADWHLRRLYDAASAYLDSPDS